MPNPPRKKRSPQSEASSESQGSEVRLQRVLAAAGFGSRRKCEELIVEGRVDIDGKPVSELGTKVNPSVSKVRVDGVPIKQPKLVYFALNKPTGIVTTNRDPQGRPRVIDMINEPQRTFPVGRLDRNSEGLILMTNDGDLAEVLAHPRHGVKKTYMVTVAGIVNPETMKQMREGVYFTEGRFKVEEVHLKRTRGKATELEIVLREGKNREIRRILARLGHKVVQLRRTAIGSIRLHDLPLGAYRALTSQEVKKLRDEVAHSKTEDIKKPRRKSKPASRKSAVVNADAPMRDGTKRKRRPSPEVAPARARKIGDIVINSDPDGGKSGTLIGVPAEMNTPQRKKPAKKRVAKTNARGAKNSTGKPTSKATGRKKRRR